MAMKKKYFILSIVVVSAFIVGGLMLDKWTSPPRIPLHTLYSGSQGQSTTEPTLSAYIPVKDAYTQTVVYNDSKTAKFPDREQLKRLSHFAERCSDPEAFAHIARSRKDFARALMYSKRYDVIHCKVPKTGCTVMTNVIAVMEFGKRIADDVFSVKRSEVHSKVQKMIEVPFNKALMQQSRVILIARNPYSRLFSTYIDKIYLPPCWRPKSMGKGRNSSLPKCKTNMTFQTFLESIIDTVKFGLQLNQHWRPADRICEPCSANPNTSFIMKQETFTEDLLKILEHLKVREKDFNVIKDILKENKIRAIVPSVIEEVFTKAQALIKRRCMKPDEVATRVWRSLKIQGYVREDIDLPSSTFHGSEQALNHTFFTELVLNTIDKDPLSSTDSSAQRQKALASAYKDVDDKTIRKIQAIYKQDFELFGYSKEPPFL